MARLIRNLTALACLALAVTRFGWTDAFHASAAAAGAIMMAAILHALGRRMHSASAPVEVVGSPAVRSIVLGVAAGGLLIGGAGAVVGLAKLTPLFSGYLDRDRTAVMARVDSAESTHDWVTDIAVLEARLAQPATAEFKQALHTHLASALFEAGKASSDPGSASEFFARAAEAQRRIGVDATLGDELRKEAHADLGLQRRLAALKRAGAWHEAAAVLRGAKSERRLVPHRVAVDLELFEALSAEAVATADPGSKLGIIDEALRVAEGANLDAQAAKGLRDEAGAEIGRNRAASARMNELMRAAETRPDERSALLRQAISLAEGARISADSCRELLARTEAEAASEMLFEARIAALRSAGSWAEATRILEAGQLESAAAFQGRRRELLRDCLIEWAGHSDDSAALPLSKRAVDVATEGGVDATLARAALASATEKLRMRKETEAARIKPRDLPRGVQFRIETVDRSFYPPALGIEVTVLDNEARSIHGLEAKDFRIVLDGRSISDVRLSEVDPSTSPPSVVLALDRSGSMQGAPVIAMVSGAQQFLRGLDQIHGSVEVLSFADLVEEECGWTRDPAYAGRLVSKNLRASGGTKLVQALRRAVVDASERPEPRCVILFTDGGDDAAWSGLPQVLETAAGAQVKVSTIGLRTDTVDFKTLECIATATGGVFYEAAGLHALSRSFASAAQRLASQRYRMVICAEGPGPTESMTVSVGSPATAQSVRVNLGSGVAESRASR